MNYAASPGLFLLLVLKNCNQAIEYFLNDFIRDFFDELGLSCRPIKRFELMGVDGSMSL